MTKLWKTAFEIKLGWIGLVWTRQDIVRLIMPQSDPAPVQRRMAQLAPDAIEVAPDQAPAFIAITIDRLQRYAAGEQVDFSDTPVSAGDVGEMREAIYAALRRMPYGKTQTYGELAAEAGYPGMAREIGQAMGQNPIPIIVPCHRIVAANGKLGGFSAPGGARTKEKLLALEQAQPIKPDRVQSAFAF